MHRSLPRRRHRFVPDVADQLAAIGELGERHALRQIGTGLILRHSAFLDARLTLSPSDRPGGQQT